MTNPDRPAASANLRQGCKCTCCDHSEGSDCGCLCHAEGKCAAQRPAAPAREERLTQLLTRCELMIERWTGEYGDRGLRLKAESTQSLLADVIEQLAYQDRALATLRDTFKAEDRAIYTMLDAMLLHQAEPSDFMASFPAVRALLDLQAELATLRGEIARLQEERDKAVKGELLKQDAWLHARDQAERWAEKHEEAWHRAEKAEAELATLRGHMEQMAHDRAVIEKRNAELEQEAADTEAELATLRDEIARLQGERDRLVSERPTDQPTDSTGRGRLLLNAYGRHCYGLGREATLAAIRPLVEEWRAKADEARYEEAEEAWFACAQALADRLSETPKEKQHD